MIDISNSLRLLELTEPPNSPKQAVIKDIRQRLNMLPLLDLPHAQVEKQRIMEILTSVQEADRIAGELKLKPVVLRQKGMLGGKKLFQVKSSGY